MPVPASLCNTDLALLRHGARASAYLEAMWRGDPLADAVAVDLKQMGHGPGMRMIRTACAQGIDAVPEAPASFRALFASLDAVPAWADVPGTERRLQHVSRYNRQAGIVLAAASLVSGYANSAASRPLEMTGRYLENAGMRTIEVGSWLTAIGEPGGLSRFGRGFELTVRVRLIHALVRQALREDDAWDLDAWGVPICQAYLAYTLIEFCLIPVRGMRAIGAPLLPDEEAATYDRWRYVGHLLGIDAALLPASPADQEALEDLYLLTRPPVDEYCRALVRSINAEFLAPEIAELLPRRLHRWAPSIAHALERAFLGDAIADELAIPDTHLKHVVRRAGPVVARGNGRLDRLPGALPRRAARGAAFSAAQEERLRTKYAVRHELVDDSPAGGKAHPARA